MAEIPVRKGHDMPRSQEAPRSEQIQRGAGPEQGGQEVVQTTAQPVERTRSRRVFAPRTDIYEREDGLVVLADMPGVCEDCVELNVENRVLTIHGCVEPEAQAGHQLSWQEYEVGDYERSFTLPEEVAVDKIEATVRQGVLRVVLPKSETARPRKIQVKAG